MNADGTLAAVALSEKSSIAFIDLAQKQVTAVLGTGYYPSHLAFSGTRLLVTNAASGTVSVIDTATRTLVQDVTVGLGPSGIAATATLAVVANMQAGTLSFIDLSTYAVSTIALPAGARPHEIAISESAGKTVVTTPTSNAFLLVDLATKAVAPVETSVWNAMGPGAVAVNNSVAYIANQMTASVTVVDVAAAKVVKTFAVDPGPRSLAIDAAKNQLLVLAEGSGTLDVVDLASGAITTRLNAADTERPDNWTLPVVSAIGPNSAAAGSSLSLVVRGANLQAVTDIEFHLPYFGGMGGGMGGNGMGGGGAMGGAGDSESDPNIKVSNVQINAAGTEITASVQVLPAAAAGTRIVHLETGRGEVMGMASVSLFTVTGSGKP